MSHSSASFQHRIFRDVAFIRAFEEKVLSFTQTTPPVVSGSVHLCAGQEVVPLAAVAALRDDDQIVCTYRGHAWAIASGIDPCRVMAEICHKADGLNGGRAGSAYMMAPDSRFIGENSIVGAGTTIACGVAMANQLKGDGRVVVVTIGDGAMNQGAVHEAMAFAAVRKLPVIFVVENNGWSELTPTDDMFRIDRLAQRARGYGFPSATIDGTDPAAVKDTVAIAAERARAGEGPSLLEFKLPRLWGHYHADLQHYRSAANIAEDEARDPLRRLKTFLSESGELSDAEGEALILAQKGAVDAMAEQVAASAAPDPTTALSHITASPAPATRPSVLEVREMTYIQAVNLALRNILETDPSAVVYGEDVGKSGGIFQASRRLQKDFGADRVFDTPIAENAILGSAVGAAMSGLRPIVEIMWADFLFVALDQLVNQAANIRYITQGKSSVPLVVRTQQGATPGSCAQHSQSIEAMLAHVPGLKVALAATAEDAYALLRAAAADPDPCIVIEARKLYQTRGEVAVTAEAEQVGAARLRRDGTDIAILSWGTAVASALEASEALAVEGVEASVLDLRWLSPLDEALIEKVVRRAGGRVLVTHEACRTAGFGAELLVRLQERMTDVRIAGVRVTAHDSPMPAAPELQRALLPSAERIVQTARDLLARSPLKS